MAIAPLKVNFGQVLMNIQPLVADLPSVCDWQQKPKKIFTSAPYEYVESRSQIQADPNAPPELGMTFTIHFPFIFCFRVFALARLSSTAAHQQQEAQRQGGGEAGQAQVQPLHLQPASPQPPVSECSSVFTSSGDILAVGSTPVFTDATIEPVVSFPPPQIRLTLQKTQNLTKPLASCLIPQLSVAAAMGSLPSFPLHPASSSSHALFQGQPLPQALLHPAPGPMAPTHSQVLFSPY